MGRGQVQICEKKLPLPQHLVPLLAGEFERAADSTLVSTLRDKATPARFLATSGYARAYEFACSQGLTDHPLFIENAASCPE